MNKRYIMSSVVVLAVTLAGAARAADGWGVSARASTLGLGAEVARTINQQFTARVGFNTFSYDDDRTENGIDYDTELDLQNINAFVDYHVMGNPFRITAGYLFSNNELDMNAKGTGATVNIGNSNIALAATDQLNGDAELDSGGYLGIGWGRPGNESGWSFLVDVGVVFQGSPSVSLTASQSLQDKIMAAGFDPTTELSREEAELEDDLDEFEVYPVIGLGVTYTF